jgi:hypothetical protein
VGELMGLAASPLDIQRVIDCLFDGAHGALGGTEATA